MSDAVARSKLIVKQLILNINYIFSSVGKIFYILMIVSFALVLPIIFVPIKFALGLIFFIGAILPASIIYISTNFNFRKSTLYLNQSTTKSSRANFYISSVFLYVIVTYALTIVIYLMLLIAQECNLLLYGWTKLPTGDEEYTLLNINFVWLIYSMGELALTTFALLFFCQSIIDSERTMYIIILATMLLTIIYGGVFNDYFRWPRPYNETTYWLSFYDSNNALDFLYYPTMLIFPFFSPMQHLSQLCWSVCKEYDYMNVKLFQWQPVDFYISYGIDSSSALGLAMHWNIMYLMPYLHVISLGASGILISKFKGNH